MGKLVMTENPELKTLMESAWDIRLRNFGTDITWINPVRTAVFSVTGKVCGVNCAHCGGKYLEHMIPIEQWQDFNSLDICSCLVSGGCDRSGRVPIEKHIHIFSELSKNWRLNMHLGLISEDAVKKIAPYCHVVSFDFVVDDRTIRDVYGFPASGQEFIRTYCMLRQYVNVIPHICIGLHGGELSGELNAIHTLADIGADAIVFIVFIPTPGTAYENRTPPSVESVVHIISTARCLFPHTPIHLGCMRPHGRYRQALDPMAVKAGVNRIVIPAQSARVKALELGLDALWKEERCAL